MLNSLDDCGSGSFKGGRNDMSFLFKGQKKKKGDMKGRLWLKVVQGW